MLMLTGRKLFRNHSGGMENIFRNESDVFLESAKSFCSFVSCNRLKIWRNRIRHDKFYERQRISTSSTGTASVSEGREMMEDAGAAGSLFVAIVVPILMRRNKRERGTLRVALRLAEVAWP